jgi:hypothetical protein
MVCDSEWLICASIRVWIAFISGFAMLAFVSCQLFGFSITAKSREHFVLFRWWQKNGEHFSFIMAEGCGERISFYFVGNGKMRSMSL